MADLPPYVPDQYKARGYTFRHSIMPRSDSPVDQVITWRAAEARRWRYEAGYRWPAHNVERWTEWCDG